MNPRILLRGLALIGALVAAGLVLKTTQWGAALDKEWVDGFVRRQGSMGGMIFAAAGALFIAVGVPRQVISFLGGYVFGFVWGTVAAAAATIGGCVIAFTFARAMGRDLVAARFSGRIGKVDDFLRGNPFSMALLIRLLPAGSNLVISLTAGVTSVSPWPFFLGSAIGYLPQTMVFALAGSGITLEPAFRIGLSVVLFIVSGVLGVYLYRKHRHGRTLGGRLEKQLEIEAETSGGGNRTDGGR